MIEADQATEPPPSAEDKEVAPPAPANPVNTVPLEGQYGTLSIIWNSSKSFIQWVNKKK